MPDRLWGQLLLQLVLIAINAFFASTEMAVISLNDKKVRKLAEGGDKKALRLLDFVERPEKFLSTIQVGITLAGYLGSAFAADNFAGRIRDWVVDDLGFSLLSPETVNTIAIIIITLILSFFTLVLGELVPKRIAMKRAEAVANMSAGVIRFTAVIMKPVVWLLSAATNGMLRMFGLDPHDDEEEVTEEEIRLMVDAGEEKGAIEPTEKELIENVFEFNNLTAADVMTHRTEMTALWIEDSEEEIIQTIIESGFSRFPVYDKDIDDIIGILSTRKFLLNLRAENKKPLKELLYPPYFVPETVRADTLFRDMQQKKIHIAIVLDEYGGTSGLVTMEDLLETLVGNIYDESDSEPQNTADIIDLGEGVLRVKGSVELEQLEEALGTKIVLDSEDDEDIDTVGGLVYSRLTAIPDDGPCHEVIIVGNIEITLESIEDHRVAWAKVRVIEKNEKESEEKQAEYERPDRSDKAERVDRLERAEKNGR
ncbi:MAG TPA: hemolysin family protein [Bacillota bacterium]|nr:hemolysin family protein [Bacillota bacterium]